MLTRRRFLHTSSVLAAGAVRARDVGFARISPLFVQSGNHHHDPDPYALAERAVDAAKSAGATYADVRLTITRAQRFFGTTPSEDNEMLGAGVRVLVNGSWGFLSSALWTTDEMARLARGAVDQAGANALGKTRIVDLGTIPVVQRGSWTMPVKYDPFDIPVGEKIDFLNDAQSYASSLMEGMPVYAALSFWRQQKVYASSEGSSWTQTTYVTGGQFVLGYRDQYSRNLQSGHATTDRWSPAGKGWEHISESGLIDHMPELIDDAEQSRHKVPVEPNMYDVVFNAQAMAALVDATIGAATELDRALGYEANAGGTSYLSDPLGMLGTYKVGGPLLNVTADRSTTGAAATVKWDDEAVAPETFPLVTHGVLADYQTTREQTAWLAPYYQKHNRPVRSHGCAGAESGLTITTQHAPNVRLLPGEKETSFDDLVLSVRKGIAVVHLETQMDQQQLNGVAYPVVRQINNGKLGAFMTNAELRFRAPDLWKNLTALGGPASERWTGFTGTKGQPSQETVHSVGAVPGIITNVRVVSAMRSV